MIYRSKEHRVDSGFSIVEITIVMFFFIVLSSIVIFNYRDFDDTERLRNVALDMALNVRDMQVRALSARPSAVGTTSPDAFRFAYGVYANQNVASTSYVTYVNYQGEVDATNPVLFWYLSSTDASVDFACGGGNECIRRHDLPQGYSITGIEVESVSESDASVSFLRPNPSAIIRVEDGGDDSSNKDNVVFTITSPQGATSTIVVTSSGQIYTR